MLPEPRKKISANLSMVPYGLPIQGQDVGSVPPGSKLFQYAMDLLQGVG